MKALVVAAIRSMIVKLPRSMSAQAVKSMAPSSLVGPAQAGWVDGVGAPASAAGAGCGRRRVLGVVLGEEALLVGLAREHEEHERRRR